VTPTLQPEHNPWRDDLRLARSVLAGDLQALEQFIQRMSCVPGILSHLNADHHGVLSDDDLADLGQEVLVAVWKRLPSYLGQGALESWVYPFCTQMYLNGVRSRRRKPLHSDVEHAGLLTTPEDRPIELLAASELVHRHLERLEAVQRSVIRARHFEALSFEEIAQRLGIPLSTAKSHYKRGIELLRGFLAPHLGQDFA
jgi:RNA polymerase sigma factor (sigma-70 family)